MTGNRHNALSPGHVDWVSVLVYLALVVIGWLNIYAVVHDQSQAGLFDFSQRSGMQLIWMGISFFVATAILLIDSRFYHMLAYPFYWIAILILIAVLFVGREVNGAKAWIVIGPVALQPVEFVKFTTSLAVARFMSRYSFSIHNFKDILYAGIFIMLPVMIIFLQNDAGSAVVYGAFLFVFYREGMNGWIFVGVIMAILLFVFSFLLTPFVILLLILGVSILGEAIANGRWKYKLIYLSGLALGTILIYWGSGFLPRNNIGLFGSLLITTITTLPVVIIYSYRYRLRNVYKYVLLFLGSLMFTLTVDYVFDNVLQVHQQKRILDLLGLETDLQGWGYNVNQSKIAIGSGGFWGKGFLEGTQTRYNFVPEQSTDFIFCTVGEEWGFVGSTVVLALFLVLILRLFKMGERQRESFGRIYCYSVASIFFMHVIINIGMTIGIMPVIGIPLPFFSYGGSSLLAFTVLFFVAVKLDADKREIMRKSQ